jgi:hypothetical protein
MNAYSVNALKEMGIDVAKLGCVMLDVEKLDTAGVVPAEWAYTSPNPDHWWIKGLEVGDHITLLYGLLSNANAIRVAVDEVLDGWEPEHLSIESVGSFPSTLADEPYSCIIGHVSVTPALLDAHARLSLLPHIDTFWEYRPHVTLGYVKRRHEQDAVERFGERYASYALRPVGLNYGRT